MKNQRKYSDKRQLKRQASEKLMNRLRRTSLAIEDRRVATNRMRDFNFQEGHCLKMRPFRETSLH